MVDPTLTELDRGSTTAQTTDTIQDNMEGVLKEESKVETQEPEKYISEAELMIPPQVNAAALMHLSRKLSEQYQVEVKETRGSLREGTRMTLFMRRPIALKEVLAQLPEVAQVWEMKGEDRNSHAKNNNSTKPITCLRIILKTEDDIVQLPLNM